MNEWMNLAKHPWKGKASWWAGHSSCVLYRWASPIELKFFRVLSTILYLSHFWTIGRPQVFWAGQPLSPHVPSVFSGVPHGELVCPSVVVHPRDVAAPFHLSRSARLKASLMPVLLLKSSYLHYSNYVSPCKKINLAETCRYSIHHLISWPPPKSFSKNEDKLFFFAYWIKSNW